MPFRTVALVAAVCVTIGWLLAATLTPPVARLQSLPEGEPRQAAEPAPFTEQLNRRLREAPLPPSTGRNPFGFGGRDRSESPAAAVVSAAAEVPSPAIDLPPSGPSYQLSGIGVTGDVRTAVLTDGREVHVVKVNDAVGAYTVLEITDSTVTLASDANRLTLRFAQ